MSALMRRLLQPAACRLRLRTKVGGPNQGRTGHRCLVPDAWCLPC